MARTVFLALSLFAFGCDSDLSEDAVDPPQFSVIDESGLTELAQEAIDLAPAWLRHDLSLSFQRLDAEDQDYIAPAIVDEDETWLVDEIAFVIAHLSPEVLSAKKFYPQLLGENARWIYERDEDLDYVEIVDMGAVGEDEDYYTTATYRVELEDGEVVERTIEKEIYYWYVVHPRIEDESPYYIDPWAECTRSTLQCGQAPENGSFWRWFLWEGAAEDCPEGFECPVVKDYMEGQDVLWKSLAYDSADNGAIGDVIQFIKAELNFGAGDERSIQPNRIYGLGRGNCGEWADMTSAVARTVLIPSHNVGAWGNDHTWNEFWDDGWNQWEPVNNYVLHNTYYIDSDGNSKSTPVYAVSATRGDSLIWGRSEPYAVTFDLELHVEDAEGQPVDGALVVVYGPITVYSGYEGQWWYVTETVTDIDGIARLTLGEKNAYAVRVTSDLGSYPEEDGYIAPIIEESEAGTTEVITLPALAGSMPAPLAVSSVVEVSGETDQLLSMELAVDGFRLEGQSARGHSFSLEKEAGALSWFIADEENYDLYRGGEEFEVVAHADRSMGESAELDLSGDRNWILVLANLESQATSVVGSVALEVQATVGAWKGENPQIQTSYRLRPGDTLAIQLGD